MSPEFSSYGSDSGSIGYNMLSSHSKHRTSPMLMPPFSPTSILRHKLRKLSLEMDSGLESGVDSGLDLINESDDNDEDHLMNTNNDTRHDDVPYLDNQSEFDDHLEMSHVMDEDFEMLEEHEDLQTSNRDHTPMRQSPCNIIHENNSQRFSEHPNTNHHQYPNLFQPSTKNIRKPPSLNTPVCEINHSDSISRVAFSPLSGLHHRQFKYHEGLPNNLSPTDKIKHWASNATKCKRFPDSNNADEDIDPLLLPTNTNALTTTTNTTTTTTPTIAWNIPVSSSSAPIGNFDLDAERGLALAEEADTEKFEVQQLYARLGDRRRRESVENITKRWGCSERDALELMVNVEDRQSTASKPAAIVECSLIAPPLENCFLDDLIDEQDNDAVVVSPLPCLSDQMVPSGYSDVNPQVDLSKTALDTLDNLPIRRKPPPFTHSLPTFDEEEEDEEEDNDQEHIESDELVNSTLRDSDVMDDTSEDQQEDYDDTNEIIESANNPSLLHHPLFNSHTHTPIYKSTVSLSMTTNSPRTLQTSSTMSTSFL